MGVCECTSKYYPFNFTRALNLLESKIYWPLDRPSTSVCHPLLLFPQKPVTCTASSKTTTLKRATEDKGGRGEGSICSIGVPMFVEVEIPTDPEKPAAGGGGCATWRYVDTQESARKRCVLTRLPLTGQWLHSLSNQMQPHCFFPSSSVYSLADYWRIKKRREEKKRFS